MTALSSIGGVLIAGGASRRFGAEKAMALFRGRPLMDHVADRLTGCAAIAVSASPASSAAAHAHARGFTVIADDPAHPDGPLAGICAALAWAQARGLPLLAIAPCDTPLLPTDLYATLAANLHDADAAYAVTADGEHPLCALWRVRLLAPLRETLDTGAHPAIRAFLKKRAHRVTFSNADAFANANTPHDLARLEAL